MNRRSRRSLLVFGGYLLCLGVFLIVEPNRLLTWFRAPQTHEPWIRVAGILTTVVGYYYVMAAHRLIVVLFRYTVFARLFSAVVLALLVPLAAAPKSLLLFAAIDLAGAAWTAWGMAADARPSVSGT